MPGFRAIRAATIAYHRRRVLASAWDAIVLGILPLGAAGFLAWIIARSVPTAPPALSLAERGQRPDCGAN